jgi:hypothetical protein
VASPLDGAFAPAVSFSAFSISVSFFITGATLQSVMLGLR